MFDNLITGEEKQSPVDALLNLLDKENRNSKTNLLMPHIEFQVTNYRLYLKKVFPEMSVIERDFKTIEYYNDLMVSYEGMSWNKVVEGIKEMKPQLMEANIQEGLMKK